MNVNCCPITGIPLSPEELQNAGSTISYTNDIMGNVKITHLAYMEIKAGNTKILPEIVAGICKHQSIAKKDAVFIDSDFLNGGYKKFNPPTSFSEKLIHLNKAIYLLFDQHGEHPNLHSIQNSSLGFAMFTEFDKLMERLKDENYISYKNKILAGKLQNGDPYYICKPIQMTPKGLSTFWTFTPFFMLTNADII